MANLEIFVDESGYFGSYDMNNSYYLFTLLLCSSSNDISKFEQSYFEQLKLLNYGSTYFHAGPIIRRENEFKDVKINTRRSIFNKMSFFVKHIPINYFCIKVHKKECSNDLELISKLSRELNRMIENNLSIFQNFNSIKIYYDNGQKQLMTILATTFSKFFKNTEFIIVDPHDFVLFQAADYISTLELINLKFSEGKNSKSEISFFKDQRSFTKNYYHHITLKRL